MKSIIVSLLGIIASLLSSCDSRQESSENYKSEYDVYVEAIRFNEELPNRGHLSWDELLRAEKEARRLQDIDQEKGTWTERVVYYKWCDTCKRRETNPYHDSVCPECRYDLRTIKTSRLVKRYDG